MRALNVTPNEALHLIAKKQAADDLYVRKEKIHSIWMKVCRNSGSGYLLDL
jgi:hypothetical protein